MSRILKTGTRGSELALAQADMFEAAVRQAISDVIIERTVIKTTGDKNQDVRLAELSGATGTPVDKGIFTKELEVSLANGSVNVAVHSLKDVPTEIDPIFWVAGVLERAPVEDVFISRIPVPDGLAGLPANAVLATSSVRRRCQILEARPDLKVEEIRGNVPTRMRKLIQQESLDGILLARAGLERLGWDPMSGTMEIDGITLHSKVLSEEEMMPAAGQGAVGLEIRADDPFAAEIVAAVNHQETWLRVRCEREFLRLLQAGCHTPVGISTKIEGGMLTANAKVYTDDPVAPKCVSAKGEADDPEAVAAQLFDGLK